MRLYRVCDWDGVSRGQAPGGPLHVPRSRQGAGRHDAPDLYGAWYCTRVPVAAIAETIQAFRGQPLSLQDLTRPDGRRKALVIVEVSEPRVVDLDDPRQLVAHGWRPSQVASPRRSVTQPLARTLFAEGADALEWWSALDADWINVTVFAERVRGRVTLAAMPVPLTLEHPDVHTAALRLGVALRA